jgi:hypothetical protein
VSVINGFYCADCADELVAKRGIDPTQGVAQAELETLSEESVAPPELGVNAPTPGAEVGGRLNLYA